METLHWLQTLREEMKANGIQWLPIEVDHCARVAELPFHHRDPFDRLLIAQAMVEGVSLLSRDTRLSSYDIQRIW